MKIAALTILGCLIFPPICHPQTGNDTALQQEVNAAFRLAIQKPDSALQIAEKGMARAIQTRDKKLEAYSFKTKGWAQFHQGSYDSAFANLDRATALFRQMHDSVETMYMYINTGIALSADSRFAKAAGYLLLADTLSDLLNNNRIKAEVNRQMGILCREQGDYKKAIYYFRESMSLNLSVQDTMHYTEAATSLSIVFMKMSMPDSSLAILNQCAPILKRIRGNEYQKAMLDERYGDAYLALAEYPRALEKYKSAYGVFVDGDKKADMAYEALNIGSTYEKMKNHAEAEKYLLMSFRVADSLRETHYAKDAAECLAGMYKATNDWKNAYKWVMTTDSLSDSLQLNEQNEKTAQLTAKYETDKKDKEIALLKKDQELSSITAQRQKVFRYGAITLVALLLLIGFLVINRYRIIQRSKRLVELEKVRNHIARDLHDDMGSTLSSINIISRIALERAKGEEVSGHLEKIKDNSGNMLETMSEIVWAINPGNDTLDKVIIRMKEFASDILDPLNIRYEFVLDGDFSEVKMDLGQRRDFYLIFKEAVNNAAKYSHCKRIEILLSRHASFMGMQIIDDGDGFDKATIKPGNGLNNMQQRALYMHGALEVISSVGSGTAIKLDIKIT